MNVLGAGETISKGCIRSRKETNCPFDLGFRVSIACRMAVDSYRPGRTLKWDPVKEEIV